MTKAEVETTVDLQTQTNRLNAETIRLVAEANELGSKHLQELKRIGEWLQRDLVPEATRLAQLERDLREREARGQQADKLTAEQTELKRQADTQAQANQRSVAEAQTRKAAAEAAERKAAEALKNQEQA